MTRSQNTKHHSDKKHQPKIENKLKKITEPECKACPGGKIIKQLHQTGVHSFLYFPSEKSAFVFQMAKLSCSSPRSKKMQIPNNQGHQLITFRAAAWEY